MKKKVIISEEFQNPNQRPDQGEKENFKIEKMKVLGRSSEKVDTRSKFNYIPKKNYREIKSSDVVIVSLSGERNFKAVTNWMRKHMETYPEVRDGFLVRFIDSKGNMGYKVEPCNDREKGEKINGINYKISPYEFSTSEKEEIKRVIKNQKKEIIDTLNNGRNIDNQMKSDLYNTLNQKK